MLLLVPREIAFTFDINVSSTESQNLVFPETLKGCNRGFSRRHQSKIYVSTSLDNHLKSKIELYQIPVIDHSKNFAPSSRYTKSG